MGPRSPEEICTLFQRYISAGDLDGVLSVYDRDVAFVQRSGDVVNGIPALREQLQPFVAARASFEFDILRVAHAGDTALMHTSWTITMPGEAPAASHAIEVARRQSDGSWRWLIGDPFTVGQFPGRR